MAATRRIMDNDERCVLVDFLAHNLLAGDLIPGWPMNRGGLGARSLNIELQKALNPPGEIHIEHFGSTFCPGDRMAAKSPTALVSSTSWCSPTRRGSTRAKVRNTEPW